MTPETVDRRIAGFDMGRQYIAWATMTGRPGGTWSLERHGLILPPLLGGTNNFGSGLEFFRTFFYHFLREDLAIDFYAAERFIKMQGSAGSASEDVNLLLGQMGGLNSSPVRNVDWKSWFKRKVHVDGAPAFFGLPTDHEGDAAGIALYLGSVLLPRRMKTSPTPHVV